MAGMFSSNTVGGYLFGIRDPDDPEKYIYIGMSERPWEMIFRMVYNRHGKPEFYEMINKILNNTPLGVELLSQIVVDRYVAEKEGTAIPPLPPPHPYRKRLEWDILDEIDYSEDDTRFSINLSARTAVIRMKDKLLAEGKISDRFVSRGTGKKRGRPKKPAPPPKPKKFRKRLNDQYY